MAKRFKVPINLVGLPADPASGSAGDIYFNTTSDVIKIYANNAWRDLSTYSGAVIVDTTAPADPLEGQLWYDNDSSQVFVYDGSYWVEIALGPQGPAGLGLPVGGSTNQFLIKSSNNNYETQWLTLPAKDLTSTDISNLSGTTANVQDQIDALATDLGNTTTLYVPIADVGAADGVVGLNSNSNAIVPGSSIIFEGTTSNEYETTLEVADPTADRTITLPNISGTVVTTGDTGTVTNSMLAGSIANNKLANSTITINGFPISLGGEAAYSTDNINEGTINKYFSAELAQDAVATALSNGTHTNITVSYNDNTNAISLTGAVTYTDENAQDAVGNAVGNGLDYDDSTGAISVDPSEFTLNSVGTPNADLSMGSYRITNLATPTSPSDAATKSYVDNTTAGLNFHESVQAATTTNLNATYSNGTNGVGATLTANSNGSLIIDNYILSLSERVLVKNQTTASQNGIYIVTNIGDISNPWILTRATDADNSPSGELAYGDFCFVQNGDANAGYGYILNTTGTITVGTTSISYTQFNAGQSVVAGNGLTETSPGTLAINTAITADLTSVQTLTSKTLVTPVISSISNTGTLTLPTSSDTLVGRNTTDTLTNKTINLSSNTFSTTLAQLNTAVSNANLASLDGAEILTNKTINGPDNTITNISLTSSVTGTLPIANGGTGLSSLGTGIQTFLGTPSSSNLASAITDETGTGSLVFANTPTLTNPIFSTAGGDEGGQIEFGLAATNTTLNTRVAIDIFQNRLRIFETGGSNRGYFLDLSNGITGVNSNLDSSIVVTNAQASNYGLLTSDRGKLIEMSGGGTLTITDSSSFPVGFTVDVLQTGASQVTIAGSGFTPNATPGLKLRAQWSSATLVKRGLNSWVVMGDLSA